MENGNWIILVLWKTRIREFFFFNPEFPFCGKRELENSGFVENQNQRIFFFLTQNSRFVESGNWRILVLWKTRIGEFFFFLSQNSRFVETENSRFVETGNWRILVV